MKVKTVIRGVSLSAPFKRQFNFNYMNKTPAIQKLIKRLADIIEANPSCQFHIDNDNWQVRLPAKDESEDGVLLADSDDFAYSSEWYGHSSNYGFALSEAMIELLNRRGFDIKASAV